MVFKLCSLGPQVPQRQVRSWRGGLARSGRPAGPLSGTLGLAGSPFGESIPLPSSLQHLDHVVLPRLPDRCAPLPAAQGPPELILMAEGTWRD